MIRTVGRHLADLAALLALTASGAAFAQGGGRIEGRIDLEGLDAPLRGLGPIVVYLDAAEGQLDFIVPDSELQIVQKNAEFSPPFGIVVKGQTVEMPNLDAIYHNVFSYSRPNDFDLGIYPAGESRSVRFDHPGIVKTYCSIHESMNLTLFVSPSPWYVLVRSSGRFSITGVPPGEYLLRTWNGKLPASVRPITVGAAETLHVEISLLGDRG